MFDEFDVQENQIFFSYRLLMCGLINNWQQNVDALYNKPISQWGIMDAYDAALTVEWAIDEPTGLFHASLQDAIDYANIAKGEDFLYYSQVMRENAEKLTVLAEQSWTSKQLWKLDRWLYNKEIKYYDDMDRLRRLIMFKGKRVDKETDQKLN